MEKITLHVKHMICPRCTTVISHELEQLGVAFEIKKLGEVTLFNANSQTVEAVGQVLDRHGFEIIADKDTQLVEQIKLAIIDLVHHQKEPAQNIRNSDYIARKTGRSYSSLSKLFSKHEQVTIEKYIILQKIEKVKELLEYDQMNLSEIASRMGYSSVHHLSSQFKNVTGTSVNQYKECKDQKRTPLDAV